MTCKIFDLGAARPHVTAPACCPHCAHEWVAVAPAGVDGAGPELLECPSCYQMGNAVRHARVKNALGVLDSLRDALLSGQVIAFAAVGIEPDDTTRAWLSSTEGVSRLRMMGAIQHLGHLYGHGELDE